MADLKAVPTEYKSIVYRSKSEAMFARYLELDLEESAAIHRYHRHKNIFGSGGGFVYEPRYLSVQGWLPDFLVWRVWPRYDEIVPVISYAVIEYKPSRPTATYVKKFFSKCFVLHEAFINTLGNDVAYRTDYQLYFGSVFNDDDGLFQSISIGPESIGYCEQAGGWLANYADEIKATRFDLEAANA